MESSVKITVSGIVQGVGFRYYCYKKAKLYGLFGYAKNLNNGNVEVVVYGNENLINDFIKDLKIGPTSSKVTSIDVQNIEIKNKYTDFEIF